eukprot:5752833-Prymnesium_polylepis.1
MSSCCSGSAHRVQGTPLHSTKSCGTPPRHTQAECHPWPGRSPPARALGVSRHGVRTRCCASEQCEGGVRAHEGR